MLLSPHTQLGHYEIQEGIGKGGMGEVYLARDTKLDRDVAIKVLPEALSQDEERLARFEREAKLLAQLNHANIATLHGLEESEGRTFLVMELVEGDSLAEQIARGPIPHEEARPLFIQIAEGLEAAHEKGIIHRDLKPANIKVTPEGKVKILDFGLAKAFTANEDVSAETSQSPTLTRLRQGYGGQARQGTELGAIMGTASYMSPEQARGKPVDKRTDIWAFGCCLYEALNGKKAFDGETVSDVIGAVMRAEPDWDLLPSTFQPLVKRCLVKDARRRLRDIGDARIDLEEKQDLPVTPPAVAALPKQTWRLWLPWALTALVLVIASLAVWGITRSESRLPQPVVRFEVSLPKEIRLSTGARRDVALSPDATSLAFVANGQIHLRAMDQIAAVPIPGTEDAHNPVFGPDGRWLAYWQSGQLKKVPVAGGAPVVLCDAPAVFGSSWSTTGTILFSVFGQGIAHVPSAGGSPEVLIPIPAHEGIARQPQLLTEGNAVLFTLSPGLGSWGQAQVIVQVLETGERHVLVEGGIGARYLPTGHLVYVQRGILYGVPFDVEHLVVTGGPAPLIEGIAQQMSSGVAHFDTSRSGSLMYVPSIVFSRKLVWVERGGREEPLPEPGRPFQHPRLSPDGRRIALTIDETNRDIWVYDLKRNTLDRLTFDPDEDETPLWTPDSQHVIFAANRKGKRLTLKRRADGSGKEEMLNVGESSHHHLGAISADGTALSFSELAGSTDLWVAAVGDPAATRPFLQTEHNEQAPTLSPDGRWLAYESTETGRSEIFVQVFPDGGSKRQISTDGGSEPLWSANNWELFYRNGDKMMAVDVETQPTFHVSKPRVLFEGRFERLSWDGRNYDVTADGERFLMLKSDDSEAASPIIVLNWFAELEWLVPIN